MLLLMACQSTCGRAIGMHSLVAPVVLHTGAVHPDARRGAQRNVKPPHWGLAPYADMTDVQIAHQGQ